MEKALAQIAYERRLDVLEMIYAAKSGHLGGSMGCMDLLACLYYQVMDIEKIRGLRPDRDRFILSKGHNAEALYAVLADVGLMEKPLLKTYARMDTTLAGHPTRKVPGVEVATGALGHGLPLGVGMALGLKRSGIPAHVYVLMGDGEQAEGSVWEAAMAAAKYRLENLTAIIDRNGLQISGETEQVMPLEALRQKYEAFGWHVAVCDGHNSGSILTALMSRPSRRPTAIIAKTQKGYGSAITANQAAWHHRVPTEEQYRGIKADLLAAMGQG